MPLNNDQRNALIDAVNQSALEPDQKSSLMGLLNEKKRYGLVWEDKPEYAKERMKNELPVLVDVPERYVEGASPDSPHHVLIEGDNYNALTALQYTHAGKVDVIYIDPPYNTGNKDFSYQDTFKDEPEFIDREHRFRHSTWLSFMEKRLKLAKALLKETGVIFISIDDNEQAQLKLLCDEIFGEGNFVGNVAWESKTKSQNTKTAFNKLQPKVEHILVYAKKENPRFNLIKIGEKEYPENDEKGAFRLYKIEQMNAGGVRGRNSMIFPILDISPSIGKQWKLGIETIEEFLERNDILVLDGAPTIKMRPDDERNEVAEPFWGFIGKDLGTAETAKKELTRILGNAEHCFETVKPVELIAKIVFHASSPNSLILDFFAGSGTTLHATMALNAEDGGKRQCILVTNNENNICEQVTYERNKRVIQGYTNSKGQAVEGLKDNHLHYFKVDFTPSEKTIRNQRTLTSKLADILRLKENAFTSVHSDMDKVRIWKGAEKNILLVQDVTGITDAVQWIAQQEMPCKVYVFAPGAYPFVDDFAEVENKVELIAMPEAYRDAIEIALPTESLLSQGGAE